MNGDAPANIQTVKVSDRKIVIPRIEKDDRKVKGADWFPKPYANMFACAKTNSGKSTVLVNCVDHIKSTATKIIIISPTVDLDPTYKAAIKKWEKQGNPVDTFKSIVDDDGVNLIFQFLQDNHTEDSDEDTAENRLEKLAKPQVPCQPPSKIRCTPLAPVAPSTTITTATISKSKLKPPRPKYLSPATIIILDDLGKQMRDPAVGQLLRTSRQYHASVLCSSQHLYDMESASINQLQYIFIFSKFSRDKLAELYKLISIFIPFEEFYALYTDATAAPYSFLYISRDGEFRKGFTEKYILPNA